jgi:hypothetical protein
MAAGENPAGLKSVQPWGQIAGKDLRGLVLIQGDDVMMKWFFSLRGAVVLSILTLVSQLWRGYLDAMFVMPVEYSDEGTLQLAAVIFTVLFAGWALAIWSAGQGSRRGLAATFVVNGLVLLAIPVGFLLFYCPADCRADAGIFNLANTLNLVLGLLAGISLLGQLWPRSAAMVRAEA